MLKKSLSEYVTRTDTGWVDLFVKHPDRGSLAAAADQHGVLPLFAHALSLKGISCEMAQAGARDIAFRNLALAADLVQQVGALRDLGIQVLAYKGPFSVSSSMEM